MSKSKDNVDEQVDRGNDSEEITDDLLFAEYEDVRLSLRQELIIEPEDDVEEECIPEEVVRRKSKGRKHPYFYDFLKPCHTSCHIPYIRDWKAFLATEKYMVKNRLRELPITVDSTEIQYVQLCFEDLYTLYFAKRLVNEDDKPMITYYMIKSYNKKNALSWDLLKSIKYEKSILTATKFPFIGHLEFLYKDEQHIHLGFPFIAGYTLRAYLQENIRLDESLIKFYTVQLILALEYLHFVNIIYRNLKPENILVEPNGYIKLIGFMKAKYIKCRTYTHCMSLEYTAPECLNNLKGYGFSADWWALAVNIYEMGAGFTPFYCGIQEKTADRILNGIFKMPVFFTYDLKDLLMKMLYPDLRYRAGLTMYGIKTIKKHNWLSGSPWMDILNRKVRPPFIPELRNPLMERTFLSYDEETLNSNSFSKFCTDFEYDDK
ncbi:cAMP-dependent protein kinase catalytic subunit 1-like [Rhodnius prolixus]|uniref:Uncharacterized protein n=1 Tax=Rhodnius prolixus TaxID=13249 RepID=T1HHZ7_RHOPR